jgi:hypothetical protein
MALLNNVMRFRLGLALSAVGLAGAVVGIYWDPINGRELAAESIGLMQTLATAGGAAFCVLGAVMMVMPRREPAQARAGRPIIKSTAGRDIQQPKKKKTSAGGRRRRNRIKR